MNFSVLSLGTGIALFCLSLLIGLEIMFLIEQNIFLVFTGAAGILWCCDTSLVPALKYDGVM